MCLHFWFCTEFRIRQEHMRHFSEKREVQEVLFQQEWTETNYLDHLKKLKLYKKRKTSLFSLIGNSQLFIDQKNDLWILQTPDSSLLPSLSNLLWFVISTAYIYLTLTLGWLKRKNPSWQPKRKPHEETQEISIWWFLPSRRNFPSPRFHSP